MGDFEKEVVGEAEGFFKKHKKAFIVAGAVVAVLALVFLFA